MSASVIFYNFILFDFDGVIKIIDIIMINIATKYRILTRKLSSEEQITQV